MTIIDGHALNTSALDACSDSVRRAYNSGARVIVEAVLPDGSIHRRSGHHIGKTTGWRPAYLLIATSRSDGSSDVLGPRDEVVGWWHGDGYYDRIGTRVKVNAGWREEPGAYGVKRVPTTQAEFICGSCGRGWNEDITPAGRCPWEHLHV